MMKGTKHEHDFVIYHDAMSAWKSDEAMQYMKDKGICKDLLLFKLDDTKPALGEKDCGGWLVLSLTRMVSTTSRET